MVLTASVSASSSRDTISLPPFQGAARSLRRVARGRQFAYVGALTLLVILLGAVGVWSFDRGAPDASIRTFGDAVWWAATLVTTVNSGLEAATPEARVIAILLRLYAVSVFGYVTASIASYFVGREVEERAAEATGRDNPALREQLACVQREVALLRVELAERRTPGAD